MRPTVADFRPDIPYRLRHRVGPRLTRLARLVGRPEFRLRQAGYAGTVAMPMDEFERALDRELTEETREGDEGLDGAERSALLREQ